MGQSEEKPFPGREGGGGGGECVREKKKPEWPNTLFFSFLPINALRLPEKKSKQKLNKQEQHEQLKIN